MFKKLPRKYFEDMLEYTKDAIEICDLLSFEEFQNSKINYLAAIRCLEVIGEAANKLPEIILHNYPDVEWKKIISTRNRLIHGYDSISYSTVWSIVKQNLPT